MGFLDFYFCLLEFSILELGLFWAGSYGCVAVGLACKLVVGPAGRISTVDCSRVLNVNRSLYSSTSRVERSEMLCERSDHACTRPRLVLL